MRWQVSFYNDILYEDLMRWPSKIKGRFIRLVELMEEYGTNLGMPHTRALGDGLFELRVKGQEGIGRVIFCYGYGKKVVFLHGFIKKTQEIPLKELRLAKERLKEVKKYEL